MSELNPLPPEVPPLTGTLPSRCQRDLDSLQRFIDQKANRSSIGPPVSPLDFREVLLTGATGFLGRYLLRDLLRRNPDLTVACIVRADHSQHAFSRIRAALKEAEIWEDEFTSRIHAIAGNIQLPQLGLELSRYALLCEQIDAVYHLASDVSLNSSYLDLQKTNVFSTQNVLDLCLTKRLKHIFFASTMGVFPEYIHAFAEEYSGNQITHQMQPDISSMKRAFPLNLLGYPWTKLLVEQCLIYAARIGIPMAIFRLPHSSAASTGFENQGDIGARFIASIADVELIPEGFTMKGSLAAADVVTYTIAAISLNPSRRFTIYHYSEDHSLSYDVQLADFGLYYRVVPYDVFKRTCLARGKKSPLHGYWSILDSFAPYWFSGDTAAPSHRVCNRALRADCPIPITWPSAYTMLRRSGDWARAHLETWPYCIPESRLNYDHLVDRARSLAREYDVPFDSAFPAWKLEGLRQLIQAINKPKAKVRKERFGDLAFDFTRMLRNNAALVAERQRYPEIKKQEIFRPVFIVGANRTGTTFLHRLLSRDSRFWSLRGYEYVEPVLLGGDYATLAGSKNDPRRVFGRDLMDASGVADMFKDVHHFDLDEPEEDLGLLKMGFAAWSVTVRFHIPEVAHWLAARGSEESYAFHRYAMQGYTYQRRQRPNSGKEQWLFKMPFHLFELKALIKSYPDALFIQTHREPAQFVGSWCSLVERARSLSCDPHPPEDLGAEQLEFMSRMLDCMVNFRTNHPELEDRWLDISFYDLVRSPMEIVAHIYNRFGWSLKPEAVTVMDHWLELQSARRKNQERHKYHLSDFNLTREKVNEAFSHYRDFLTSSGIRSSMLLG